MYGTARQCMHPLRASLGGVDDQRQECFHRLGNQLLVASAAIVPVRSSGVPRGKFRTTSERTRICELDSLHAMQ